MKSLPLVWVLAAFTAVANAETGHWSHNGPDGGKVHALFVDPSDPSRLYIGTDGAIFRSTDSAATWQPPSLPDGPPQIVRGFARGAGVVYAAVDRGVERSTDGGQTFSSMGWSTQYSVRSVAVHPLDDCTLVAGTSGWILKSTDCGATWGQTGSPGAEFGVIFYEPPGQSILWSASNGYGVFQSTNGGRTWTAKMQYGMQLTTTSLVQDPATPSNLWAGTESWGLVYRTTDAGKTWKSAQVFGFNTTGVLSLALEPGSSKVLYAGTVNSGIYKSTDGGVHWASSSEGLGPTYGMEFWSVTVDPHDPAVVYSASYGAGVFKSTDAGATWALASRGTSSAPMSAISQARTAPAVLWATAPGLGIFRSLDRGETWSGISSWWTGEEIHSVAVDPTNASVVYASTRGSAVVQTTNGGATWTSGSGGPYPSMGTLAIDPVRPQIVYAGADVAGRIGRSTNGGAAWSPILLPSGAGTARAIAVDPTAPDTVLVGTDVGGMFTSTDGGATWAQGSGIAPPVAAVAIHPTTGVAFAGGANAAISASTDAGATWSPFSNTGIYGTVSAITLSPSNPDVMYAAVASTVVRSTDGGKTWSRFGISDERPIASALTVDPVNPSRVSAATSAGIYVYEAPPGDVNGDGVVDVADVFFLVNELFARGAAPIGLADANGDGVADVDDVFYLINFLFAGGSPPA